MTLFRLNELKRDKRNHPYPVLMLKHEKFTRICQRCDRLNSNDECDLGLTKHIFKCVKYKRRKKT